MTMTSFSLPSNMRLGGQSYLQKFQPLKRHWNPQLMLTLRPSYTPAVKWSDRWI